MKTAIAVSSAVTLIALAIGCIVSDELTTITIRPDGSAESIKFQSNIHSTEQGDKGSQELTKFVEEFDTGKNSDQQRIVEAGGEILEARWVRKEAPFANIVKAHFPTAASLENYFSVKNDKGEVVAEAHFTRDGKQRRLSLVIAVPRDEKPATKPPPSFHEFREQQANGLSETRIVVSGGRITASQGFLVATDKQSCIFEPSQIDDLLRSGSEKVELFVAWDLDDK